MAQRSDVIYRPAWWLPGAHAQTLWGKFFRRRFSGPVTTERWTTPDQDFIELHRLAAPARAPRLLFLHGLEGTIDSHYVAGFFEQAAARGWAADLLIFRGCGAEMNQAPRFYHSGDTGDLAFVLDRILADDTDGPLLLAGVSLGGNVLLKYLGEQGRALDPRIRAAATVSVPYDVEAGCRFITHGFSRVYDRHFLRTLKRKALSKLEQFPGLFDLDRLRRAATIYDFDEAVTAPVHGFASAHDYYSRSSALGWIDRVRVPTLLLSAADDPFLPRAVLADVQRVAAANPSLTLEIQEHGGHVGFVSGSVPWRESYYAERRACDFLARHLVAG